MSLDSIKIRGKEYRLPIFLPDATRGVVRSVDARDLDNAGIKGAVVNTYHLMTEPGIELLEKIGGIKKFMGFEGLVASDSGGWQVFSLIHRRGNPGLITDEGVVFSIGGGKQELFSPEKSILVQFGIGADIIVCLDDFTSPKADRAQIKESVDRTILWAKRSKKEYDSILKKNKISQNQRPFLLAVIQGGRDKKMRAYCAKELIKIGFDSYGFGGYVINDDGKLDLELAKYIADLIPDDRLKFALGVGNPYEIAQCRKMGWDLFDCTLPTRDGRHKRLYVTSKELKSVEDLDSPGFYEFLYIHRQKFQKDFAPLGKWCDCHSCRNFSRSYLRHLFKINDTAAMRLATIHNLRLYAKVIELIQAGKQQT